jgi:Glycogen recognition site of AMP-activated protein kinase
MRSCVLLILLAACRPPGYGEGHPDAAADGSLAIDAPAIDAAIDSAPLCAHGFRLDGYGTHASAWVSGDFIQWAATLQAGAIAMTLGADGGWTVTHDFVAGSYEYKFIVDGTDWILDPTNPVIIDDGMGNQNSGYTCTP